MGKPFMKPDFRHSIVNITATLAEHLRCPTGKPTLPNLAEELKNDYKNVVFLILDGLGASPLEKNLAPDAFLRKNVKDILTSVFPSTTTCATTSYLTGKYPMEHGWLGWSLYFEELRMSVDLFPETESSTRIPIEKGFVKRTLPVILFYKAAKERKVSVVVPAYWDGDDENRYEWENFDGLLAHIENICRQGEKQFIYTYFDQPDGVMHRFGVSSQEAKACIGEIDSGLEKLFGRLEDTLLIVSADHGQVDIGENIELYADEELLSMLTAPPYLDSRATAFKVKDGQNEKFVTYFQEKYGWDFDLFRSEDLIRQNYFGGSFIGEHAALLGDYIAVATSDKILLHHPIPYRFKGHHAAYTAEEMQVPIIYIGRK